MQQNYQYKFDLDENGFPALTEKNVALVNFIFESDAYYRSDFDPENDDSTYNLVRRIGESYDPDEIEKVVTKVDIYNSTHQASEGQKKGNQGRRITAEHIADTDRFYERLEEGDPDLVNDLAGAISSRYTFSFASKYCSYVSRYLYDSDEYSIYDTVLFNILPYYAWVYCGEKYITSRGNSTIPKVFAMSGKGDYRGYRELINQIRKAAAKINGYLIRREDFDHLLWYYFKGDRDIKDEKKNIIHESRTTKALKLVGEEDRVLSKIQKEE